MGLKQQRAKVGRSDLEAILRIKAAERSGENAPTSTMLIQDPSNPPQNGSSKELSVKAIASPAQESGNIVEIPLELADKLLEEIDKLQMLDEGESRKYRKLEDGVSVEDGEREVIFRQSSKTGEILFEFHLTAEQPDHKLLGDFPQSRIYRFVKDKGLVELILDSELFPMGLPELLFPVCRIKRDGEIHSVGITQNIGGGTIGSESEDNKANPGIVIRPNISIKLRAKPEKDITDFIDITAQNEIEWFIAVNSIDLIAERYIDNARISIVQKNWKSIGHRNFHDVWFKKYLFEAKDNFVNEILCSQIAEMMGYVPKLRYHGRTACPEGVDNEQDDSKELMGSQNSINTPSSNSEDVGSEQDDSEESMGSQDSINTPSSNSEDVGSEQDDSEGSMGSQDSINNPPSNSEDVGSEQDDSEGSMGSQDSIYVLLSKSARTKDDDTLRDEDYTSGRIHGRLLYLNETTMAVTKGYFSTIVTEDMLRKTGHYFGHNKSLLNQRNGRVRVVSYDFGCNFAIFTKESEKKPGTSFVLENPTALSIIFIIVSHFNKMPEAHKREFFSALYVARKLTPEILNHLPCVIAGCFDDEELTSAKKFFELNSKTLLDWIIEEPDKAEFSSPHFYHNTEYEMYSDLLRIDDAIAYCSIVDQIPAAISAFTLNLEGISHLFHSLDGVTRFQQEAQKYLKNNIYFVSFLDVLKEESISYPKWGFILSTILSVDDRSDVDHNFYVSMADHRKVIEFCIKQLNESPAVQEVIGRIKNIKEEMKAKIRDNMFKMSKEYLEQEEITDQHLAKQFADEIFYDEKVQSLIGESSGSALDSSPEFPQLGELALH